MNYFLLNYVDDFIGCEYESRVEDTHKALIRLLDNIGIDRSVKKSVAPTQVIDFLGNLVNTIDMTIGVTPNRKTEILAELERWKFKKDCKRREVESLIGKLQFMSNCIRPGRLFISRMLADMKRMCRDRWYSVSEEMRKDLKWWYLFLPGFHGTSILWLLEKCEVDGEMSMDACLEAMGGMCSNEYIRCRFPEEVRKNGANIAHLEMWAVIICVKVWGKHMNGKIIRIKTDNEAISKIINSSRSSDPLLQKQLRELIWWLAKYEFMVKGVHILGIHNRIPDICRWHEGPAMEKEFHGRGGAHMTRQWVDRSMFRYTHDW